MKRFVFRLQKLLDWRRQRKEAQSAAVARALEALRGEQDQLRTLAGQHAVAQDGLRRQRAGLIDPRQVMRTEAFELWLRQRLDEQRERTRAALQRLEQERRSLTALAREEKMLQKLRDRQAQRHRLETLHLDARELDDIASVRHQFAQQDPATSQKESIRALE